MNSAGMVAVNGRLLTRPPSGIQRYLVEQLWHFPDPVEIFVPGPVYPTVVIDPRHRVTLLPNRFPHDHLWEQLAFRYAVRRSPVVWSPFSVGLPWCNRLVFTLHDLSFFEEDSSGGRVARAWYQAIVRVVARSSRFVLADSEHVAVSVRERFSLSSERVVATPLAASPYWGEPPSPSEIVSLAVGDGPFILTVGTAPRKNIRTIIRAWQIARQDVSGLRLVIVGRAVAWADEFPDVEWVGGVSDDALRSLYRNALAFVFASRYEGFGLPVLEAMSAGCPVIAANATCIPEVAGDAAFLVNTDDSAAYARHIVELHRIPSQREQKVSAGLKQAAKFTWEKTAAATWKVIQEASTPAKGKR